MARMMQSAPIGAGESLRNLGKSSVQGLGIEGATHQSMNDTKFRKTKLSMTLPDSRVELEQCPVFVLPISAGRSA